MATYVCTIAGTTKTLQQGWTIRETANGRTIFSGGVYSANASYRPAIGAEVLITENGTRIFGGHIDTPSESGAGGFGITPIVTRVSAVDFNALADRRFVINGGFPAGHTLLQCVTDLNGYLASYGVTVDAAQVTGPSLTAAVPYDVRSITSILDELCVIFSGQSSTSYVWHIDYNKKLRVFTIGTYAAPVSITTANRFAEGDVTVQPSRLEYANRILVMAGTGTSEVTDSYISNGVATVLPLTYQLSTHRGYVTNQGVNEPIGVTTPPYWTVDTTANTITRSSAPVNLNAISITYIAQFPYVAQSNDTGEQTANGIWEKVVTVPTVFNAATALDIARGYLLRGTVTSQTVTYVTRQLGIKPGQTQTITVAARNISGSFLITDVQTTSLPTRIPTVQRTVTAVGGTQYPGSWQDKFKSWGGATSGTTVGGNITIVEGGGGGSSGTGTIGTLAKWTATDTLGNSAFTESGGAFTSGATGAGFTIALSASAVTGTLADARLTTNVPLKDASLNTFTGSRSVANTLTTSLIVSPGGGAATLDSGLLLAISVSGGGTATNLPIAPTGDLILNPAGRDILPGQNYYTNLGMLSNKYLTLHAAELWVETLVAQDVMATIGGRIVVSPTTTLILDLSAAAVPTGTMYVKHNNIGISDIVRMESGGKVEFMQAASGASVVSGGYSYLMTRNLDGTGANDWFAGDAVVGTNFFIDLYSTAGVLSGYGPTIVGNVRTGVNYQNIAPRWAIGNLDGLYGYSVTTFGSAFGDPAATNVTVDATNGFRIRHGTTNKLYADTAGNLSLVGDLSLGTAGSIRSGATGPSTGTGYWLDYNAGAPRFRVGNPASNHMAWDGTDLTIVSGNLTVNASGVVIPAPVALSEASSYRFSTTHAGTNSFGLYGREIDANARWLQLRHTTNTAGKSIVTVVNASSSVLASNITLTATDTDASIELTATSGVTINRTFLAFAEKVVTPATPASNDAWHAYARSGKFIFQFNDAGTVRYFYLDGTGTSGTWTYTTTAP